MSVSTPQTNTQSELTRAAEHLLQILRRDRDRQIIIQRFGFDLPKRQTLEKIGRQFGITRERVRQIEKAAIKRLAASEDAELVAIDRQLAELLEGYGGVAPIEDLAASLGIDPTAAPYLVFFALLAPGVELIEETDDLRPALGLLPVYPKNQVRDLVAEIVATVRDLGEPIKLSKLQKALPSELEANTLEQLCRISKHLATLDDNWGLARWPEVNPRSIRDKTYLVLIRHTQPLHFSEIAVRIRDLGSGKQNVTVQAVHNELIKDPRFILIGRGIYALAEWGYTPGTVADIIAQVLAEEQPLHKDEIIHRVLQKRQVKTTTIILNLQEKDQFVRTAKATYKLKDD